MGLSGRISVDQRCESSMENGMEGFLVFAQFHSYCGCV